MEEKKSFSEKIKMAKRKIIGVVIGLVILFTAVNSIYFVNETQTAVITTFGKATENSGKGLQIKIPFFQNVQLVDTTVKNICIGYGVYDDGTTYDVNDESIMITSDMNFIDVDYNISYSVSDAIKYLYNSTSPDEMVRNISMEAIRSVISAYTVDSVMTTGKNEIQFNIKDQIVKRFELEDLGLTVIEATMQDAEPPTNEVANAFKAVETAKQQKETAINNANKYRNEKIPEAQATSDEIIQKANAQKEARINEATGQVARFNAEYEEYIKYPLITKQRMFYETMEDLLPDMKVIIDNGTNIQKYYPVESFVGSEIGGTQSEK